jgi:BirA family biotin operon repressor/biotin-[acetyl-CoA-carboxylase] ligase
MSSSFALTVVENLDSTTAELLRRPLGEAAVGTALLALRQSGGRGRSERVWESPPGGMYLSVVLRPYEPRGLSLLGALVALELLQRYGLSPRLRWPNDVMLQGRKIAGVLPVARYQGNRLERAVLGVGLNVRQAPESFPLELRGHVTTLAGLLPQRAWEVVEVARDYLAGLEQQLERLQQEGLESLCRRCEDYLEGLRQERVPVLVTAGQAVRPLPGIVGLAPDGALMLDGGQRLHGLGRDERLRFQDEV